MAKKIRMRGREFEVGRDKQTGETLVSHKWKGEDTVVHRSEHRVDNRTLDDLAIQTGPMSAYRDMSRKAREYREKHDPDDVAGMSMEYADMIARFGTARIGYFRPGPKSADLPSRGISNGREARTVFKNGKWTREAM